MKIVNEAKVPPQSSESILGFGCGGEEDGGGDCKEEDVVDEEEEIHFSLDQSITS